MNWMLWFVYQMPHQSPWSKIYGYPFLSTTKKSLRPTTKIRKKHPKESRKCVTPNIFLYHLLCSRNQLQKLIKPSLTICNDTRFYSSEGYQRKVSNSVTSTYFGTDVDNS